MDPIKTIFLNEHMCISINIYVPNNLQRNNDCGEVFTSIADGKLIISYILMLLLFLDWWAFCTRSLVSVLDFILT